MEEVKAKFIVYRLQHKENDECQNDDELGIYPLRSYDQNMLSRNGYIAKMDINGKPCMMELPTAEDLSIMTKSEGLDNCNNNINDILTFIERKKT